MTGVQIAIVALVAIGITLLLAGLLGRMNRVERRDGQGVDAGDSASVFFGGGQGHHGASHHGAAAHGDGGGSDGGSDGGGGDGGGGD